MSQIPSSSKSSSSPKPLNQLRITLGQYSDKGRKELNQDFHGACVPEDSQLSLKGVAVVMADGISSSDVSHIASESAVQSFLEDYYCTSDAWSVKNSVERVLSASNSWLYSQTQKSPYRYDKDRGYVCTVSALVLKAETAYIFHVGDTRVYRLNAEGLEQLTNDHRLWVTQGKSYLSRALGIEAHCEFDHRALKTKPGDIFILATDGVYEFAGAPFIQNTIVEQCLENSLERTNSLEQENSLEQKDSPEQENPLDQAARAIVEHALAQGSDDNLSIQIVRVDAIPVQTESEVQSQIDELPFPPVLDARMQFDGYTILREMHSSSRSHVYLAQDNTSAEQVVIKTPSVDLRSDAAYLERFLTEEWIARRLNSAYVLKAGRQDRQRRYLYTVTEFVEGQTLAQWINDNPQPDLEMVRNIVEQIAKGLRAFHRMEMLHQDLKPDNIMLDSSGTVRIIDFGSVWVAGLAERSADAEPNELLGTALYTAPEYFLGESGTTRSELFSLGVITYFMLSGRFPYGTKVSAARTVMAQKRLEYQSVLDDERDIPLWIDQAIRKAVHPSPHKRYEDISEFLYDLRHPNKLFVNRVRPPLIQRNPVAVWQGVSLFLFVIIIVLLSHHF